MACAPVSVVGLLRQRGRRCTPALSRTTSLVSWTVGVSGKERMSIERAVRLPVFFAGLLLYAIAAAEVPQYVQSHALPPRWVSQFLRTHFGRRSMFDRVFLRAGPETPRGSLRVPRLRRSSLVDSFRLRHPVRLCLLMPLIVESAVDFRFPLGGIVPIAALAINTIMNSDIPLWQSGCLSRTTGTHGCSTLRCRRW